MRSPAADFLMEYRATQSSKWEPPPLWTDVAMYAHGALDHCQTLMRDARKHIAFSMRANTACRPVRAMHHMPHAANWFRRATDEYARASELLERTTIVIELLPESVDVLVALRVIVEMTQRLIDIHRELRELSSRIEQRSHEIYEEGMLAALEGRLVLEEPSAPPRPFLLRTNLSESIRVLFRRRGRRHAASAEEAPRRVSRGRAPPLAA